ncbi:MAG TPA: RNA polymerase sigma factor SigZ [Vicinamibacteria bacterium]|nr:RNA polymerase sigma factor SigZ [Vicinamibacteria bacterium]
MTEQAQSGVLTEAVWREFHQRLRSYLRKRVANEADAEDLLQDVFTRIHENAHRLGELRSVSGWVHSITRNAVVDFYRSEGSRAGRFAVADAGDVDANGSTEDSASPARDELAACIEPLLTQIHPRYAVPLSLTELNGATQKDAAERMGLTLSAMKSRVSRGRRKLKELLLQCCHVELDRRQGIADFESRNATFCTCTLQK